MAAQGSPAVDDPRPSAEDEYLASPEYWDRTWVGEAPHDYLGPIYDFHPLFSRVLPRGAGLRLLELGSARGFTLTYLHKEFDYEVSGVDSSAEGIRVAREHCSRNHVPAKLYQGDLFALDLPGAFDVVYSGGLVEHFANLDLVLRRHVALLRPGGTIVLGVPNMRGLHGILVRHLHPAMYAIHNASSCSPWALRSALERVEPGWRYRYCGYGSTFRFQYSVPSPLPLLARVVSKVLRTLGLDHMPNRWFSPDAYVIADRPAGGTSGTPSRA